MKNSFIKSYVGFTLPEIVIAITISVIVMSGIFGFLMNLQHDISQSKESTRIYTSLTDFIGTMNNFSKLYSSGTIIVAGSGIYNASLLMRPDKGAGVLIGIVEQKNGNTLFQLDPILNKSIYGKKVIAYQKLTTSQINSLLTTTGSVYNIDFSDEGLFKYLSVTDFVITPYNSGSLLEYTFTVESPIYEPLIGQQRANIEPDVKTLSFTLDF